MTAAGFYHCSVKSVGRANGRSIVAAAAYRHGERLYDERTGEVADYRARSGVLDGFIVAPSWAHDRARLWNGAEAAEHRANGRLATELELALPHELDAAERKRLLKDFLAPIIERYGVAADVAIHEPGQGRDHRNIHAHVLITNRRLDEHGFIEKEKGQRKDTGLSGFAMGSEAVIEIRKAWEQHVNRAYEQAGLDIRVDHRSHKERGIEQEPTKHLGPVANAMEQRGEASERGDINREIEARNAALRDLAQLEIEAVKAEAELAAAKMLAEMERPDRDSYDAQWSEAVAAAGIKAAAEAEREAERRKHRQPESDDMDDDIATKQREQRQAAEDRQAAIYNDMVAERNRADRFLQDWQRDHDNGERNKRYLQEAQWRREAESDITDVNARAILAAGESRDFVQAVRREGAMITQEHADIGRQAALETDPDKKQLLYLKQDIQQADYMALANERIAAMSNLNGEQYKDALRQQEVWAKIGTDLRKDRLELQERMADQEMDRITEAVGRMNAADQQRAGFRADIRGIQPAAPETPREAAQAQEAAAASPAPGSPATRASEAEPPAEIIYLGPAVPERQEPARENTDARQRQTQEAESSRENTDARQSNSADNAEITDSKAAKKAALAQTRAETEQSIAQGQERSFGHSR